MRSLERLAPFSWSTYRFAREGDVYEFKQAVGPPRGRSGERRRLGRKRTGGVPDALAQPDYVSQRAFSPDERGNILEWEQTLADRLRGTPIEIDVQLETQSILARTLLLFAATIVAALVTLAVMIWWMARRAPKGSRSRFAVRRFAVRGSDPAPANRRTTGVRDVRDPVRFRSRSSDRSSPRRRQTSWRSIARASDRCCC